MLFNHPLTFRTDCQQQQVFTSTAKVNALYAHLPSAYPALWATATAAPKQLALPRLWLIVQRGSLWRRLPWASGQGAGPSRGASDRRCGKRTGWTLAFWGLYMFHSSASGVTEGLPHHPAKAYLKFKKINSWRSLIYLYIDCKFVVKAKHLSF